VIDTETEGGVEMWERSGWVVVHHGWWPGIFGELIPLLFLVAVLAFGVWAVRRITDGNRLVAGSAPRTAGIATAGADGALQELRLRYARGDVDRDEFTQRLHDLGGEGPEPPPPPPPAAA
jgi:uncharacterized membrane protein